MSASMPKLCHLFLVFSVRSCTVIGARMSHRKWRETEEQLTWWPDLALLGCSLVSLHFQCDILAPITVQHWTERLVSGCGNFLSIFPKMADRQRGGWIPSLGSTIAGNFQNHAKLLVQLCRWVMNPLILCNCLCSIVEPIHQNTDSF